MDDYISREAVIKTLERMCLGCPCDRTLCGKCAANTFKRQVMEMPAADVRPVVHAHWIEEEGCQICSNCGEEHEWIDYRAPFCDNCGVDMREATK